jgi:hypothetical protein
MSTNADARAGGAGVAAVSGCAAPDIAEHGETPGSRQALRDEYEVRAAFKRLSLGKSIWVRVPKFEQLSGYPEVWVAVTALDCVSWGDLERIADEETV